MKYYRIVMTSEHHGTDITFARIQADNMYHAYQIAYRMVAEPNYWKILETHVI